MKILVIGGTRYFGKRLIHLLLDCGHTVTVLTRGKAKDDLGPKVERLQADRTSQKEMSKALCHRSFDAVVDQICMTGQDALHAIDLFQDKTNYYLMTSTMSVYQPFKKNMREEDFDPKNIVHIEDNPYAEGKRAAENVFATRASFPVSFARFPVVLGLDDYTERLFQQIKRVKQSLPLYYPNLDAEFSFISSGDAAEALLWLLKNKQVGAFNFASPDSIKIGELIKLIELETGEKAVLKNDSSLPSPFAIESDCTLNVERANSHGFHASPLSQWLRPLIREYANMSFSDGP